MKRTISRILTALFVLALISSARTTDAWAQDANQPQAAQSVSQTGLLPIYGVDFNFDPAWVDGAKFPSHAAEYPYSGVNNSFQQVWDALKSSGFNVVRFQLDVRDSSSAPNRLANLCVWARQNGVKLIPVLLAADRGTFPGKEYPQNVATLVSSTIAALRSGDGQSLAAYSQILAYQIEDQVNHPGLHQPYYPQYVAPLVRQVGAQLRQSEQSSLKGTESGATPLLVNVSFDFELILKQAIAGATMTDDAYKQAYDRVKQSLLAIAAVPEVDLLDVQWLAGSMSAGNPERFAPLLRNLSADVPGKQFIFTTGFSTGFRSGEDQQAFFALTSVNLADYRASAGMDAPFLGVILHEALKGKDLNPAPPKPQTSSEMARWNFAVKSMELIDTWSTKKPSADMIWWLRKVEGNFGLLTLQADGAGALSIVAGPGQQRLQQFASAVSESSSAAGAIEPAAGAPAVTGAPPPLPDPLEASTTGTPLPDDATSTGLPPIDPSFKRLLKEKAELGLSTLMDRVIERLANKVSGAGGDAPVGGPVPGPDYGSPATSAAPLPSISVAYEDVSVVPLSPRSGERVAFSVTLRNPGSPDAIGLVVALVDETGSLLGTETQLTDVVVPAGATQVVALNWIAGDARTYQPLLTVLDSTLTSQLASLSLPPLVVSTSAARATGVLSTSSAIRGAISPEVAAAVMLPIGLPHVRSMSLGTGAEALRAGVPSPVTVSLSNPYGRPLSSVTATLVVDGRTVASKPLGTLLPKQDRSVLFPGVVFARAGSQQVRVVLESRGAKTLTGHVSRQVLVGSTIGTSNPSIPNRPPLTPSLAPSGQPSSARPAVRPLLPALIVGVGSSTGPSGGKAATPSAAKPATGLSTPPKVGNRAGAVVSPIIVAPPSSSPVRNPTASRGGSDEMRANKPVSAAVPQVVKPDLTVEWVTYQGATPAGATIVLKLRVKNIGTAKALGTATAGANGYMIDLILSSDSLIPETPASYSASFAEDAMLPGGRISRTTDINPGESLEYEAKVVIPANTPKTKISLCARVDSLNKIAELNERNNVVLWGIKVR